MQAPYISVEEELPAERNALQVRLEKEENGKEEKRWQK